MMERPILFSTSMVQALLRPNDPKSQTRRVAKIGRVGVVNDRGDGKFRVERVGCGHTTGWEIIRCPYGATGDRLWVREKWAPQHGKRIIYFADPPTGSKYGCANGDPRCPGDEDCPHTFRWRPSIHLPRKHARITLEITGVRLERLHQITGRDARAEGVEFFDGWWLGADHPIKETPKVFNTARDAFASRWDALNGKREGCDWKADPWVWVVEFRRLTP